MMKWNLSKLTKLTSFALGTIIVELKAVNVKDDAHWSQVYNYFHTTSYKLGLLLNFRCPNELEMNESCYKDYSFHLSDS